MIKIDLNNPEFQANLLAMPKPEDWAVLKTLRLLQGMSWEQLQRSKGLHWEYSRSCRAVAWRDGSWLRLLSLHPNHDSAY